MREHYNHFHFKTEIPPVGKPFVVATLATKISFEIDRPAKKATSVLPEKYDQILGARDSFPKSHPPEYFMLVE